MRKKRASPMSAAKAAGDFYPTWRNMQVWVSEKACGVVHSLTER